MEQRKLIQHGLSSLTVALPMKWLKERDLKKGDSVYVDIEGNQLILSTEESLKMEKISIDVTKLDRTSTLMYIMSLYRFGYNEIEVTFNKPNTPHYRTGKEVSYFEVINEIVNRCIGAEIIEQSDKRILIKYITKEAGEDFKVILRRVFLLINETAESLLEGIKNKDMTLIGTIDTKHDNINKFISYCLRLLNKYGYADVKKTSYFFHIIASLDKIVDVLKYNSRDILNYKKKFAPLTLEIWEDINKSIRWYYEFFYDFKLEKVNRINQNRDAIKNRLRENTERLPNEELMYLTKMVQILETILDLCDFRMGLEN
ncbi:MAG: AbrB/MazE/SpoVT family DNA-binding domain-containing protein [archaeon]